MTRATTSRLTSMGFFSGRSTPAEPPDRWRPPWVGPPEGVLPGVLNERAVVFRTDDVLLVMDHFNVFPSGMEFSLNLSMRDPDPAAGLERPLKFHGPQHSDMLRFGIRFADGRSWSNVAPEYPMQPGDEPEGPIVFPSGGSGGSGRWDMSYWLWPLPPEGDLEFIADWPAQGIEECSATIDGTSIRAAAARAEVIWPE